MCWKCILNNPNLISQELDQGKMQVISYGKLHKKHELLLQFTICCLVGSKNVKSKVIKKVIGESHAPVLHRASIKWSSFLFWIKLCSQMSSLINIEIIPSLCCCSLTCSLLIVCVCHCQKHISLCWSLLPCGLWKNNTRGYSRFVQPTVEVSNCSQLQVCVCVCVCVCVFVCMHMWKGCALAVQRAIQFEAKSQSSFSPITVTPHPATRPLYH